MTDGIFIWEQAMTYLCSRVDKDILDNTSTRPMLTTLPAFLMYTAQALDRILTITRPPAMPLLSRALYIAASLPYSP